MLLIVMDNLLWNRTKDHKLASCISLKPVDVIKCSTHWFFALMLMNWQILTRMMCGGL